MENILRISPDDDLLVALEDLPVGGEIETASGRVVLPQRVPAKHKFTPVARRRGERLRMYGVTVGELQSDLPAGGLVTTENLRNATQVIRPWSAPPGPWSGPTADGLPTTFMGFERKDGRVGTANYWLVIPLVFCENRNVERLRDVLHDELGYGRDPLLGQLRTRVRESLGARDSAGVATLDQRPFPNVDGVQFVTHDAGCGGTRQDARMFSRLVAAYVNHPNVAGATVLSLGCQNAEVSQFERDLGPTDKPVFILDHQTVGDRTRYLETAIDRTLKGLALANEVTRRACPLSSLVLGLECGGSDGFSGISANPALGYATDLLVGGGGTAILAEFPELAGVEQELIDRCRNAETATRFMELMRAYGAAAERSGSSFDANPSPGNIRDGLITDAMKSAGAAKKGGTSPVVATLDYTEPVTGLGLHLLCTPGNDVESTTALVASGANIIVFTTGLGTPTGNPIVPVVKVSSNSELATRMPDLIDFDAGAIIRGRADIPTTGEQLFKRIIRHASGQPTRAMRNGQEDFIVWKRGVSL